MSSNTNSLAEIISKAQNRAITAYLDKFQTADNIERAKDEAIAAILALLPEKRPHEQDEHVKTFKCVHIEGWNDAIDQIHTNFKGGK